MTKKSFETEVDSDIEINREANEGELLLSRLRNSEIRRQACDLMYRLGRLDTSGGKVIDGQTAETWPIDEWAPSLKDVEELYNARLADIERVTPINFGTDDNHTAEAMYPHALNSDTGARYTPKQLSAIEAHEKGHVVRDYKGPQYDEYFREGFGKFRDTTFSSDIIARVKHKLATAPILNKDGQPYPENVDEISDSEAKEYMLDYLFSGREIAERMNQLKNYFGFAGTEQFTKKHLDIARQYYVEDLGTDNGMNYFFEAISPETEERFLYLINHSGI